ncbi:MAG: hypothetical protein VB066_04800 [Paludibacter sp.]|nr:hypothetical protein [Paludibacter sp.]
MKRTTSLMIGCLLMFYINAQIPCLFPSSTSVAATSVADLNNWSAFHNPAPLSELENPQLFIQADNRYNITALSTKCFSIAYPTNYFVSGIAFSHFGFSLYHEMMLGLAFARNFSDKFNIGLQFNYLAAYFPSSNSYHGTFFPQIGLNFPLNKTFIMGFHVFNPFQSKLKSDFTTKRLPAIFSVGFSTKFSTNFTWRVQADKEISSNYRFATAADYQISQVLRFQAGLYGYEYLIPCLGFGCKFKRFSLDLITELHPLLGLTTMAAMKFMFPAKK